MIRVKVAGFSAREHGFPFPNSYPPNSPVIEVPTPWGTVPIGDAKYGLCGGMVYAALDLFLHQVPRPETVTRPVFKYFCRRLLESWNFPFGVLKYYDWQCRPNASKFVAGVLLVQGVNRLMIQQEWPLIRADLDLGMPVPLGLVKAFGFHPKLLNQNHQVLAYGYTLDGDSVELNIYDPNFPSDDTSTLKFNLSNPDAGELVQHSCEGPTVRGIFRAEYRKPVSLPALV